MSVSKSVLVNGENLRKLRDDKAWSREVLADKAGMSSKTVQRAENNEKLKLEYINQLSNALGCSQEDLISDSDNAEQIQQELADHHELVRLKRPDSAKELFKAINTDVLDFEFDIDFDEELSKTISNLIIPIEELRENKTKRILKTSDEVLGIGKLSTSLKQLEEINICIFIGFTTHREYESYNNFYTIKEKTKAVILFGNCNNKTRAEIVNVGLTYNEAKTWLDEKLDETKKYNNIYVYGRDYGFKENTRYNSGVIPPSGEFDDEIPF